MPIYVGTPLSSLNHELGPRIWIPFLLFPFLYRVRAMSGRRTEGARSGVLPYPWLSHDDTWGKEEERGSIGRREIEKELTGALVDPQTGGLVTSYTGLIHCKIIMKILWARLVAVPCDTFHQARTCPRADAGRDTKAGDASLSEIQRTWCMTYRPDSDTVGKTPTFQSHH